MSNLKLGLLISTEGASKSVADLLAIQGAVRDTAASAPGIARLAGALGTNFQAAQRLATSLNLTGDQAAEAVAILRELSAIGADNATKFAVLTTRLDLTADQVQRLNAEANKTGGDRSLLSKGGLGSVIQGAGQLFLAFQGVLAVIQGLQAAGTGAYNALIGANEQLNAQLLQSQTTLAATAQISRDGQILGGTEAIEATREALSDAIKKIEKDTESLVGVTSEQVNGVFAIALNNAGDLVDQSQKFADPIEAATELTKGFAATLGTLNVPLDQARQEITSILKGQIDSNSVVAKSLGLTNEQVLKYKQQGILVDELNKRFDAFVKGNALAANSISGISSNILDAFQRISREVGQPLLQPTIDALQEVYDFIKQNEQAIQDFAGSTIEGLGNFFGPILDELGRQFTVITGLIQKAFSENEPQIREFLNVIGPLLQGAILLTVRVFGALQQQFVNLANSPLADNLRKGLIQTLQILNKAVEGANRVLEKLGLAARDTSKDFGDLGSGIATELQRGDAAGKAFAARFSNLKISSKPLEDLGSTADALQKKLDGALNTLASGAGGDSARAKQAADDITSLTQTALEQGQITTEQAIANLQKVANDTRLLPETRLAAEKAQTQIVQQEGQRQVAAVDTQIKQVEARIASQQLSEAEGDRQVTDLKIKQLELRAVAQRRLAETAGPESQAGRAALEQEKSLQAEISKTRAEFQQRQEQRRIQAVEREAKRATDVARQAEQDRLNAVQRLENQGLLSKREIEKRKLAIAEDRINAEIAATQRQVTALNNLPAPKDPEKRAEREAQIRQLQLQRASLTQQLLQNEAQQQENLRQAIIDGIKRQVAQQQIATDRAVRGLTQEKAGQDAIAASIERRQKLLQASQNLDKAVGDARVGAAERELTSLDRAIALRKELAETDNPEKRRIIQEQLNRLGLTGAETELQLLDKRQAIEDRIAQQKLANLAAEQQRAQVNLELDIQREAIAARRAVIEAQIAEAQAKQQVAAAQGAIQEAQQIQDPEQRAQAVAQAQSQLEAAQQGLGLAAQARADAQQQVTDQQAIAQNARQTLAVQQESERTAAATDESFRQLDQSLAAVEARAGGFANTLQTVVESSAQIKANLDAMSRASLPQAVRQEGITPGGPTGAPTAFTAPQSAQFLSQAPAGVTAPPSVAVGGDPSAVVKELQGLRADMGKAPRPVQQNSFTLVNEVDPTAKVVELSQQMATAQAVAGGK